MPGDEVNREHLDCRDEIGVDKEDTKAHMRYVIKPVAKNPVPSQQGNRQQQGHRRLHDHEVRRRHWPLQRVPHHAHQRHDQQRQPKLGDPYLCLLPVVRKRHAQQIHRKQVNCFFDRAIGATAPKVDRQKPKGNDEPVQLRSFPVNRQKHWRHQVKQGDGWHKPKWGQVLAGQQEKQDLLPNWLVVKPRPHAHTVYVLREDDQRRYGQQQIGRYDRLELLFQISLVPETCAEVLEQVTRDKKEKNR